MDLRALLAGSLNRTRRLFSGARSPDSPITPAGTPDDLGADSPNEPKNLPDPQRPVPTNYNVGRAIPAEEYVSGGANPFLGSYLRVLPQYIDQITREFGDDVYERMLADDQVSASVYGFISMVLAEEVNLRPAIDDKTSPDYLQSKRILDFCERCVADLERGLDEVLEEMALATALGNKVAEQVYEPVESGDFAGRLALRAIRCKPRNTTGFVVDAKNNVVGLRGIIPGRSLTIAVGSMVIDPAVLTNVIPRQKFAVLTWRERNGDPRGNSICHAAYKAWWEKQCVATDYMKYLAQFASPSLLGIVGPNATPEFPTDANGDVIPGAAPVNPVQALLQTLLTWINGAAAAVPNGTEVKTVFTATTGEAFINKLKYCDDRIARAVLNSTRLTQEAQHGSKADSETAQDVSGNLVRFGRRVVSRMLSRDVLRNLVLYNWGKDAPSG